MRHEDLTQDELLILHLCEAGRLAILTEEVNHYEAEMPPLTSLQKEIIRQRYRDRAVDIFKEVDFERIHEIFDRLYRENEEAHKDDGLAYC